MDNWTVAHYIIEKGIENIENWTKEEIKEVIKELYTKEDEINKTGWTSVLSPSYQENLILTAKKVVTEGKAMKVIAKMISNSTYLDKV